MQTHQPKAKKAAVKKQTQQTAKKCEKTLDKRGRKAYNNKADSRKGSTSEAKVKRTERYSREPKQESECKTQVKRKRTISYQS